MFKNIFLLASVLGLSSCAYFLDQQIQDVTITTPGARNSVCYLYIDGLRYKVNPPEAAHISKSENDMVVDCLAPGNRRRKVVVQSILSKHAPLNVTNGIVPGTTWDYMSDSLFTYPSTIEVDFTSAPLVPELMPAQNSPDIKQPEEYRLEEFRPGLPRLNSDSAEPAFPAKKRAHEAAKPSYTESTITESTTGTPADKGDLGAVINNMKSDMNPSGTPTGSAPTSAPTPTPMQAPPPSAIAPVSKPETAGPPVPKYPGQ